MSAFEKGGNGDMGAGMDLDDLLAQMFGMSGGVPPGFGGGAGAGPRKPRKGENEEQNYQVTLEELYKGKTVKFASKKNIICSHCKGTGGKDKAKPKQCGSCQGRGEQALNMLFRVCAEDEASHRLQASVATGRTRPRHTRDSGMQCLQRLR